MKKKSFQNDFFRLYSGVLSWHWTIAILSWNKFVTEYNRKLQKTHGGWGNSQNSMSAVNVGRIPFMSLFWNRPSPLKYGQDWILTGGTRAVLIIWGFGLQLIWNAVSLTAQWCSHLCWNGILEAGTANITHWST